MNAAMEILGAQIMLQLLDDRAGVQVLDKVVQGCQGIVPFFVPH
jgi:hypothetical protein